MLIGIDASKVVKPFKTGTETYSIEIIKALSKIDRKNDYLLYTPKPFGERLPDLGKNFQVKILPWGKLWTQIRLSWEMLFHKPEVFFIPAHTLPLVYPKKTIVTLHDLGFRHFPELYSPIDLLYHNWAMNHAVKHAYQIITDSEFTKKDLMANYTIDPAKITVIPLGYDEEIFKPLKEKKPAQGWSALGGKPYIFYIGRLEEKKNIAGMIRAYGILRKEKAIRHQFILAGRPGFGYEKIKMETEKLPAEIRKDVIELGYVDQKTHIDYLKNADILFFCTFFEGFGLPLVEAMASGIPIVASNRTSIPEITSKAAILVNPAKPFDMAAALSRIINNNGLRKALVSKGLARASLYSWRKTAEKTLRVLEMCYNKSKEDK